MALDLFARREQDRTAAQPLVRFETFDPDEAPALWRVEIGALPKLAADIGLVGIRHLAQAQIGERVAMIELETRDMALLDPKRGERLQSIRLDPERSCRFEDALPERNAVIRGDIDFIGKLAREAQADEPHRNAIERKF